MSLAKRQHFDWGKEAPKAGFDFKYFFDRPEIEKRIGEGNARAMRSALQKIRVRARDSMKKRKKPSKANPPQPPNRHVGRNEGLGLIQFFFDPNKNTGVVGHIRFNSKAFKASGINGGAPTLPNLLNFGGRTTVRSYAYTTRGKKIAEDGTISGGRTKKTKKKRKRRKAKVGYYRYHPSAPQRRIKVEPRPVMELALTKETEEGNVIESWGGVVTG